MIYMICTCFVLLLKQDKVLQGILYFSGFDADVFERDVLTGMIEDTHERNDVVSLLIIMVSKCLTHGMCPDCWEAAGFTRFLENSVGLYAWYRLDITVCIMLLAWNEIIVCAKAAPMYVGGDLGVCRIVYIKEAFFSGLLFGYLSIAHFVYVCDTKLQDIWYAEAALDAYDEHDVVLFVFSS